MIKLGNGSMLDEKYLIPSMRFCGYCGKQCSNSAKKCVVCGVDFID